MDTKRISGWRSLIGKAATALALLALLSSAVLAEQPSGNWVKLLEGDDDGKVLPFSAWRQPTGEWLIVGEVFLDPKDEKRLAWKPGTGVAVNGPKGQTGHLLTKMEHADVEAHIEFMVSKGSNSGVYFMGRYEIQVFDSWDVKQLQHSDCGGIYQRWRDGKGFEGRPPRVNASRKPGEWQTFDVLFRAPRFDATGKKIANATFIKVVHNGKVIHENEEVTGPTRAAVFNDEKPTGPLMLQGDHGPVAYANVRIRPLEAATTAAATGPEADATYDRIAKYDFGDDRRDLTTIEEATRTATPKQRKEIETRLLAVLKSPEATYASKQWVCRVLRQIATKRSIPALAGLLADEKLSHMARYALQGMPYPEVDKVLRKALGKLSGKPKIGVIGSIAARGDRKAVGKLSKLIADSETAVAQAAVGALGRIGGAKAAKALAKAQVPDDLETIRADALLMCADEMLARGKTAKAAAIYREMLGEGNAPAVRIAALQGIVRAEDKAALPQAAEAAKSEDEAVRAAANQALESLRTR